MHSYRNHASMFKMHLPDEIVRSRFTNSIPDDLRISIASRGRVSFCAEDHVNLERRNTAESIWERRFGKAGKKRMLRTLELVQRLPCRRCFLDLRR